MKKFNVICLLLLLVFTEISAQKKSTNIALNKAGQQRMLCERMLKNYILIGANINSKKYNVELDETVSLFNENYYYLTNYATQNKTKDVLNKLNSLWSPFRSKIFEKPTKDKCVALLIDSKKIVDVCDTITEKIQMDNNVEIARTIILSNKLNILVERLAKNYMLKIWGVPYENLGKETRETVNTFEYSLGILSNSSKNTTETKAILEKEYNNWKTLKEYFNLSNTTMNADFVNSQTASMSKDFKSVTLMYQKIADGI
jgi:hypothetical protein